MLSTGSVPSVIFCAEESHFTRRTRYRFKVSVHKMLSGSSVRVKMGGGGKRLMARLAADGFTRSPRTVLPPAKSCALDARGSAVGDR